MINKKVFGTGLVRVCSSCGKNFCRGRDLFNSNDFSFYDNCFDCENNSRINGFRSIICNGK